MSKQPSKRPYRKRKRAQAEEETRLRITEAAVELHGTVGPANTTVTHVAELAGVTRMTVYNHFPTDGDLFVACSSHWFAMNPAPDAEPWSAIPDPVDRLRDALGELYGWYRQKQGMMGNVLRDAPVLPALGEIMEAAWSPYVDGVVAVLAEGWTQERGSDPGLAASLRVAVDFHTWQLLTGSGRLDDRDAADLAADMVAGGAGVTRATAAAGSG